MFKPIFGTCICCGKTGIIVVKRGLIKQCNEREKNNKKSVRVVREIIKSEKERSVPYLVGKLDAIFSLYIRHKYSKDGLVKCYTCPAILPIKQMQNGHYISRKHYSLRWEERDSRPQCYQCNILKKGNYTVFADKLNREKPGEIEILEIMKHNTMHLNVFILQTLIKKYTVELNKLIK